MATDHPYARELGEFLRARRARLRPEDVGMVPGGRRKVAGLRREEIALLAGLSTDYYQRMEQGRDVRPSDAALDGVAAALDLDEDERRHLFRLARSARHPHTRPRRAAERVPETTQRMLDALATPALVLGRHLDVLAWNRLAEALFGDPGDLPPNQRNMVALLFRDEAGRLRCSDWEAMARQYLGMLHTAIAEDPEHPRAVALVGELSIQSADFRRMWARHDVRAAISGRKQFQHPEVGGITLDWETYPLPGNPGPVLQVYTAEPGSADAERLQLLASLRAI